MKRVTIYHNPRCSKSRETLALLRERGIDPVIIDYLNDPPSREDVLSIVKMLGADAAAIVRVKEPAYTTSGLTAQSTPAAIARAIAKAPILLERPVVVCGSEAAIGRPPENVLKIV
ncbi:MAG: arsenate reductase (glutaredoxin) [Candidatus Hydrogenedentes bacterium]|nr:arsenate reductase (glutaredoxin) [Candidatus Hydrogenedentota bacterium]